MEASEEKNRLWVSVQEFASREQWDRALPLLLKIVQIDPGDILALQQLAIYYFRADRPSEAIQYFEALIRLQPNNAHLWNSQALCLQYTGRPVAAIDSFREAIRLEPKVEGFYHNLAKALEEQSEWKDAAQTYLDALVVNPRCEFCMENLAEACSNIGDYVTQLNAVEGLRSLRPLTIKELILRAEALHHFERLDEAMEEANKVLAVDPSCAPAYFLISSIHQSRGEHETAVEFAMKAIELDPKFAPAYDNWAYSKKISEEDLPMVAQMERQIHADDCTLLARSILGYALGKAHNDLKNYEQAMSYYDIANETQKALTGTVFDPVSFAKEYDDLIETFSKAFIEKGRKAGLDSKLPIFVVGMPRSGTTLTENILSSHSKVVAGGERIFWGWKGPEAVIPAEHRVDMAKAKSLAKEYLSELRAIAGDAEHVTDKLPFNYYYLGLLYMLFPEARFLHCRRHPVDTCLSFYMASMNRPSPYSFVKANIVEGYRQYARLMRHWKSVIPSDRLLDVHYEELVSEREASTRRILDFCGLEWEDSCLHPERNARVISTMSHYQARQPVYNTSIERWRRYEPWLGDFRRLIDDPPEF